MVLIFIETLCLMCIKFACTKRLSPNHLPGYWNKTEIIFIPYHIVWFKNNSLRTRNWNGIWYKLIRYKNPFSVRIRNWKWHKIKKGIRYKYIRYRYHQLLLCIRPYACCSWPKLRNTYEIILLHPSNLSHMGIEPGS